MKNQKFSINLDEDFEELPKAPIVEAIIHWVAQPARKIDPAALLIQIRERVPDYPNFRAQHELEISHQMGPNGTTLSQSHAWQSFQLKSEDQLKVAQFGRTGLVVSRLAPYQNWKTFRDEAVRLWDIYCDLVTPPEVQRLGVRYINLIPAESVATSKKLLAKTTIFSGLAGITVDQFTHQTRFTVPGKDYAVNLIQTIQPAPPNADRPLNLIVDIDVFTTAVSFPNNGETRDGMLSEMRWIKNKIFLSVFSKFALEKFRE